MIEKSEAGIHLPQRGTFRYNKRARAIVTIKGNQVCKYFDTVAEASQWRQSIFDEQYAAGLVRLGGKRHKPHCFEHRPILNKEGFVNGLWLRTAQGIYDAFELNMTDIPLRSQRSIQKHGPERAYAELCILYCQRCSLTRKHFEVMMEAGVRYMRNLSITFSDLVFCQIKHEITENNFYQNRPMVCSRMT